LWHIREKIKAEKSAKFGVLGKVPEGNTFIFGEKQIPYQNNVG